MHYEYDNLPEYNGFSDDIMMLSLEPELDDDAALEAAWEQWCAEHGSDDDGEMF